MDAITLALTDLLRELGPAAAYDVSLLEELAIHDGPNITTAVSAIVDHKVVVPDDLMERFYVVTHPDRYCYLEDYDYLAEGQAELKA
ncbi:hypothetical protein [Scrofimicrobium sp. R131]|uniref:Uncharacterized protein n=1 Tax=Scrofimicrobium appendicitidis TaxID=3079930 RepID=A0AAU7V9T5_9ACTO